MDTHVTSLLLLNLHLDSLIAHALKLQQPRLAHYNGNSGGHKPHRATLLRHQPIACHFTTSWTVDPQPA